MASTSDSPTAPTEDGLRALVGNELPGGTYTVEPWWVRLVNDCALTPADDGAASPVFAFLVATAAMGVTWAQLLQMCGASERDGPMAGESDTTVRRPLRSGGRTPCAGGSRTHDAIADGKRACSIWSAITSSSPEPTNQPSSARMPCAAVP